MLFPATPSQDDFVGKLPLGHGMCLCWSLSPFFGLGLAQCPSPQKINLDGRSCTPASTTWICMAPTPPFKGCRPALQADFVCIMKKSVNHEAGESKKVRKALLNPSKALREKCPNSGFSPKLPWEGGTKIGLAVWQEGDTHQMPLQQGNSHHLPLLSLLVLQGSSNSCLSVDCANHSR